MNVSIFPPPSDTPSVSKALARAPLGDSLVLSGLDHALARALATRSYRTDQTAPWYVPPGYVPRGDDFSQQIPRLVARAPGDALLSGITGSLVGCFSSPWLTELNCTAQFVIGSFKPQIKKCTRSRHQHTRLCSLLTTHRYHSRRYPAPLTSSTFARALENIQYGRVQHEPSSRNKDPLLLRDDASRGGKRNHQSRCRALLRTH